MDSLEILDVGGRVTLGCRSDMRQTPDVRGTLVNDLNGFTLAGRGGGHVGNQIMVLASWDMDESITS